jgi:predicted transport protein
MTSTWACPRCKRRFTRKNQRHACGTGERADVLRNRDPKLVELYEALEAFAKSLGPIELVTRERYVLFRSTRIFADLVVRPASLRLAIHLPRKAEHALFVKIAADRRHVSHVAELRGPRDLAAMKPFLKAAYEHSVLDHQAGA